MKPVFAFLYGLFLFSSTFAQKDTLRSVTGDQLIGEIKSMTKSVLSFDTDYADSDFKIEWADVASISSSTHLVVYLTDGTRLVGYFQPITETGKVKLTGSGTDLMLNLNDIVKINTLDNRFWDRIIISIDAGYSFTKAQNLSQLAINGHVGYSTDKWRLQADVNSVLTKQDEVGTTKRNEGSFQVSRDLYKRSFLFAGMEFLESSEQNLNLRTTSKLGIGYYFLRENGLYWQGALGLANANEDYGAPDYLSKNSFEGLTGMEFNAYDMGDFSVRAQVTAFPSFSNSGRVRVNSDISLKWDLPLDFYIKMSFIHNFDSKPQIAGVEKGDYVFQTNIGWEWD